MQFMTISSLSVLFAFVGLAGCGAADPSAAAEDDQDNASAKGVQTSAHGRRPTPASKWAADEPAVGAPPASTDEDTDEDGPEDLSAEDPGPGTVPAPDGVGTTAAALSTTTGTTFDLTYYWVAQRPADDPNQVTLRTCSGSFMTYASYAWRDAVRMEMTGRFTASDGTKRVFNDWDGCWKLMDSYYSWGAGVPSPYTSKPYKLRPFRSIAVDRSVLSIGKWYYVKQLDGVVMPSPVSGLVHDGCVRAVDTGWSFSGRQIDFFTGLESAYSKLDGGSSTMAGRSSITLYDGSAKCGLHIERGY